MIELTTSSKHFASINRALGPTWTDATKRKTPHKPLLLLAVLDLVHRGVITSTVQQSTGATLFIIIRQTIDSGAAGLAGDNRLGV